MHLLQLVNQDGLIFRCSIFTVLHLHFQSSIKSILVSVKSQHQSLELFLFRKRKQKHRCNFSEVTTSQMNNLFTFLVFYQTYLSNKMIRRVSLNPIHSKVLRLRAVKATCLDVSASNFTICLVSVSSVVVWFLMQET